MAYLKLIEMKHLFLTFAVMFLGVFTFAHSSKIVSELDLNNYITVTTSCGEVGTILVRENDTMEDILDMVNDMEEWLCGGN